MINFIKFRFGLVIALWVIFFSRGVGSCQLFPSPNVHIFVVHSYDQEYVWTQNINEGIRQALRGLDIVFEYFYMDAKRNSSPEALKDSALSILSQIESKKPQVVIAVDDAAQAYLVVPYLKGMTTPQVVFCGVNAPLSLYGFPASNVTGVLERWHFRQGFALLHKLFPERNSIAVLVDGSESAGYVLDDLRRDLLEGGAFDLQLVGVEQVRTFQEWKRKVLAYQERADAIALGLYHSLVDEDTGKVVAPDQVGAWNNATVTKPTLGFTDFARDHGHLVGVLESGNEQGFLAGGLVRSILETGVSAGTLPILINQKGIVFLNLKTAERLGFTIPFEFIEAGEVIIQ